MHSVSYFKPTKPYDECVSDSMEREQYYSGICSDACWDSCSEDAILCWKYIHPINYGNHQSRTKVIYLGIDK